MIQRENYTGRTLNDLAMLTCAALGRAGFDVKALPSTNPGKARNLSRSSPTVREALANRNPSCYRHEK